MELLRKTVSGMMLTLLFVGVLMLAFNIQTVKASGTIYIKADGSIDPPDAPILSVDNITYTLTGNISSDADGIVVERSNIIIDGNGYTLQGIGAPDSRGIDLAGRANVTIKNMEIKTFDIGIFLWDSFNNNIFGNNITNNYYGVYLWNSSNNSIAGNNITANNGPGIYLYEASGCFVSGNNVTNNQDGIWLDGSSNNTIVNNCAFMNGRGIVLSQSVRGAHALSSNNYIAGNNVSRRTAETGAGIALYDSEFNTIVRNNVSNENTGISLGGSGCRWNNVTENFIYECGHASIRIYYGSWNNIEQNVISQFSLGWPCAGVEISHGEFNEILHNQIPKTMFGIYLVGGSWNHIQENDISSTSNGIYMQYSSNNNTVIANNLMDNACGIRFDHNASSNTIYHNNFLDSRQYQALCSEDSNNTWDDGYPSGGNYWSDYEEKYPLAEELDGSGIWDTPYVIDENNVDNYPIVPEFTPLIILSLFIIATLLSVTLSHKRKSTRYLC